jgi:hypothetical protein
MGLFCHCEVRCEQETGATRGRPTDVTKALPLTGMVVAGLIVVVCLADLAVGIPFGGANIPFDAVCLVSSGILAYLSWSIRERKRS